MKIGWILGLFAAVALHGGVLLFGGILFLDDDVDHGTLQQVELLGPEEAVEEEDEEESDEAASEEEALETEPEDVPDVVEVMQDLELSAAAAAPALEAASLSAIEQALRGQGGGGGDCADALTFASGGRIGGTGTAGPEEDTLESAFSLAEIDQKPRAVYQSTPLYPSEMRGKKLEGVVTVIFVVDSSGKVNGPRVEKSTHPAFDRPALDAVKQWKFEPAVKGGQRVGCKMRVPIRFQPS